MCQTTETTARPFSAEVLEGLLESVNRYVAQLQSPIPLPNTKLIVTQPNEKQFSIFFCDSRRSYTTAATSEALISEVRQHCGRPNMRVAVWARLPVVTFLDLLCDLQNRGNTLFCCHEQHAVLGLIPQSE
jgi:hypothetical protein